MPTSHVRSIYESRHRCDMTHKYVTRVSWLIQTCRLTCILSHTYGAIICVTCLIHTCDMPHSYVWHASFIRVTFICATCLIHMYCLTHKEVRFYCILKHHASYITDSFVWYDSFICTASFICVTWLIHIYLGWIIHMNEPEWPWMRQYMNDHEWGRTRHAHTYIYTVCVMSHTHTYIYSLRSASFVWPRCMRCRQMADVLHICASTHLWVIWYDSFA